MTRIKCPHCKTSLAHASNFCGNCGGIVEAEGEHTQLTRSGLVIEERWHLQEILGQGGMGVVYKGVDLSSNTPCAIKVLPKKHLDDQRKKARLKREARGMSLVSHPNVVQLLDEGEVNAHHYIVMEYIPGVDLHHLLQQNYPLPLELCLHIIQQILNGLEAIHCQSLVHRDLKLHNLMVKPDLQVKILDLGLVAQTEEAGQTDWTVLTKKDTMLGTLSHMAPEQYLTPSEVDGRADIYALGIIFYQLATGKIPYTPEEFAKRVKGQPAAPPSSLRSEISVALEKIILKMMHHRPDERYQNANEVALALQVLHMDQDSEALTQVTQISAVDSLPIPGAALFGLGETQATQLRTQPTNHDEDSFADSLHLESLHGNNETISSNTAMSGIGTGMLNNTQYSTWHSVTHHMSEQFSDRSLMLLSIILIVGMFSTYFLVGSWDSKPVNANTSSIASPTTSSLTQEKPPLSPNGSKNSAHSIQMQPSELDSKMELSAPSTSQLKPAVGAPVDQQFRQLKPMKIEQAKNHKRIKSNSSSKSQQEMLHQKSNDLKPKVKKVFSQQLFE